MRDGLEQAEAVAADLVAQVGPWVSPAPTAWLTAISTIEHLDWPVILGIVAGVILECLGFASISTVLQLREYNRSKRKSDPLAPVALAGVLVGVYFAAVVALVVVVDTVPSLATFAPLCFPALSLAGMATLAIRGDHRRRLAAIRQDKAERRARRRVSSVKVDKLDSQVEGSATARRAMRDARIGKLVEFYAGNPGGAVTEAAEALNVSRPMIYSYLAELEAAGRIDRSNGSGVKVLEVG